MPCMNLTTRDVYAPRPNGSGGITQHPAPPISLNIKTTMAFAEINAKKFCPLWTLNFTSGTHDCNSKKHNLTEGVSNCMIPRQEAQANFDGYRETQEGSQDEVYNDGSKLREWMGVINHHFKNGATTTRQLSKRLTENSTIFAAEDTAISLALNYCWYMVPVHHNVVVCTDSMPYLIQSIHVAHWGKPGWSGSCSVPEAGWEGLGHFICQQEKLLSTQAWVPCFEMGFYKYISWLLLCLPLREQYCCCCEKTTSVPEIYLKIIFLISVW